MKALKKGFTIIEVLITSSIFMVIATISTVVLFDTINAEKKSDIQNSLYEDARILMDQISNKIHRNAIDYEEYFSMNVAQPKHSIADKVYGMYYGSYASKFFHPGESLVNNPPTNPANLGIECSKCKDGVASPCDALNPDECEVIFTPSQDYSVGKNPFGGSTDDELKDSNAFVGTGGTNNDPQTVDELYLINTEGTKKTIFAKQKIDGNSPETNNYGIGMLELEGLDTDQNGTNDLFTCGQEYTCSNPDIDLYNNFFHELEFPGIDNLNKIDDTDTTGLGLKFALQSSTNALYDVGTSPFIPITPFRTSVVSLKFIINPPEDPYKGFAESTIQYQPTVTILIELEPSAVEKSRYPGGWNKGANVILQRTVNPGVTGDVQSYPPTNNVKWIDNLFS